MLQKSEGTQNLQYPASIRKIIIHPEKLPKAEEGIQNKILKILYKDLYVYFLVHIIKN